MKRFAVLALAAIFAFSLSTSVYAAPEFSWELTIESETVLADDDDVIDFYGGPEASLSVAGGEEGAWDLSVEFGSIADDAGDTEIAIGKYYVTLTPEPFTFSA